MMQASRSGTSSRISIPIVPVHGRKSSIYKGPVFEG
jgi:hypothetical protein